MKDYHRSNICRLIGSDKKKNKVKTHKKEAECKCVSPYLKLHHYSCPLTKHPCPIHDRHGEKEKKLSSQDPEDSLIVSFHPSFQTDRLFQPVKDLLTRKCAPDTKISFQYYSPPETSNLKGSEIQTNSREFKNIGTNYFLDKTKSFADDKKSNAKKIKHGFYLANSVLSAKKTRSQISTKENLMKGIFSDAKKTKDVSVSVSSDRICRSRRAENENFSPIWYCCNKYESSDGEKSFIPESDFLAVTQHLQEQNQLYHKIFEIRHKKGSNEFPYLKTKKKLSEIAPQVYFAGVEESRNKTNPFKKNIFVKNRTEQKPLKSSWENQNNSKEIHEKDMKNPSKDLSGSDKSQTDSSGSVYYTPFILLPKDMSDNGKKNNVTDKGVQANGKPSDEIKRHKSKQSTLSEASQTSHLIQKLDYRTSNTEPLAPTVSEYKTKTTDPSPIRTLELDDLDTMIHHPGRKASSPKDIHSQHLVSHPKRSIRNCYSDKKQVEEECQTDPMRRRSVRDKSVGSSYMSKDNAALIKPHCLNKAVQVPDSATKGPEIISQKSNSSNDTFVKKSYHSQDSEVPPVMTRDEPIIEKEEPINASSGEKNVTPVNTKIYSHPHLIYGKSYSDGELFRRKKCLCVKLDPEFPLPPKCQCTARETYLCENKDTKTIVYLDDINRANYNKTSAFPAVFSGAKAWKPTTKDESINTSISDLKELYKIIDSRFASTSAKPHNYLVTADRTTSIDQLDEPQSSYRTFMCTAIIRENKTLEDSFTQTARPDHKPCKCHTKLEQLRNTHKNQISDDDFKQQLSVPVCRVCLKKVNIVMVDVETLTDGESLEQEVERKREEIYHESRKRPINVPKSHNLESKPPTGNTFKSERLPVPSHPSGSQKPNAGSKFGNKAVHPIIYKPLTSALPVHRKSDALKDKKDVRSKVVPAKTNGRTKGPSEQSIETKAHSPQGSPSHRASYALSQDKGSTSSKVDNNKCKSPLDPTFYFPVEVSPNWPEEAINCGQINNDSYLNVKPSRSCTKQKRNFENENDTEFEMPYEKKLKNDLCDENCYNYDPNYYNYSTNDYSSDTNDYNDMQNDSIEDEEFCQCMLNKSSSVFSSPDNSHFINYYGKRNAFIPSGSTPRFMLTNFPIVESIKSVKSEERCTRKNSQKSQKTYCSLLSIKNDSDWQEEKPFPNLHECVRCKSLTLMHTDNMNLQNGKVDLRLQNLRKSVKYDFKYLDTKNAEFSNAISEKETPEDYGGNNIFTVNCDHPNFFAVKRYSMENHCCQQAKPQMPSCYHSQKQKLSEDPCKSSEQPSTSETYTKFLYDVDNQKKISIKMKNLGSGREKR